MSYNSTFVNAISLSAAARVAYNMITSKMPLAPWFPARTNPGLDFAFDRRVASGADVAEFRDFDAENTLGQTFGNARLSGTLPPIGRNYRLLEYEQAQFYNEGKKNAATAQYLMERVGDGARAIARRLEQARIDAVLNGSVTLNENGVSAIVDFARDASLTETLAGADLWSAATSDPVADIEGWMEAARDVSGVLPTTALVSHNVYEAMRTNAALLDVAYAGMASVGTRIRRDDLVTVVGTETGLLSVVDMDRAYAIPDLDMGNPWPDNKFVLVSSPGAAFGRTEFGIVPMATDPKFGISEADRSGLFSYAFDHDNVFGLWASINALAIPTMPGVNMTFVANVL